MIASAFGIALALTAAIVPFVRLLALRFGVVDRPNARSSHQVPTARAGGLAVVIALSLVVPWFVSIPIVVGLAVCAVAVVSLFDDVHSLPFLPRLLVQALAASAIVYGLGLPGPTAGLPRVVAAPVAVLFLVGYCNIFNFMDGINGLAAGQAALSAATLSAWLIRSGCLGSAAVASALAGASAGFLPYNFPRARVFLGDVGSVTIGLVLAVLTEVAHARGGVPWSALLLIHAVFLFDAGSTILKRAARREPIVEPHREHCYQLLVRSGWSHAATTGLVLSASAACCGASFFLPRDAALVVSALILFAYATLAHTRPPASPVTHA